MNNKSFKAFIIENKDDSGLIKTLSLEDLMDGDVTVKVFLVALISKMAWQ